MHPGRGVKLSVNMCYKQSEFRSPEMMGAFVMSRRVNLCSWLSNRSAEPQRSESE